MITLMYHDIFSSSLEESGFTFRTAMPYKVEHSTFTAVLKSLNDLHPDILGRQVEFTFDDGGCSAMDAAEELESYGLQGIFFIPTEYIGKPGFLTSGQIRELHERGHIIGAHSHSHAYDKKTIALEWAKSVKILSDITDAPIKTASVPHGLVSRNIIRKAAICGITTLYTTEPTDKFHIRYGVKIKGRFCIHRNDNPATITAIILERRVQSILHIKWKLLSYFRTILGKKYVKFKDILLYRKCTLRHIQQEKG